MPQGHSKTLEFIDEQVIIGQNRNGSFAIVLEATWLDRDRRDSTQEEMAQTGPLLL
jgi:hypothetical protein